MRLGRRPEGMAVATFSELFPGVQRIDVSIILDDAPHTRLAFTNQQIATEVVRCENAACKGGGFKLGEKLRSLVEKRETKIHGRLICPGTEIQGGPCMRMAAINGLIFYA